MMSTSIAEMAVKISSILGRNDSKGSSKQDGVSNVIHGEESSADVNYILLKTLKKGGFGTVFVAKERKPSSQSPKSSTSLELAIKICRLAKGRDPDVGGTCQDLSEGSRIPHATELADFNNEAEILQLLQGTEHVVSLIEAFENKPSNEGWIVMERLVCDLGELTKTLPKKITKPLPKTASAYMRHHQPKRPKWKRPTSFACVVWHLLEGLLFLKEQGILHRDLKPENVLLSSDGYVKISDFGLAKRVSPDRFCIVKGTLGTHAFMAPELFIHDHEYSFEVDVWGFGMIVSFMHEGHDMNLAPEGKLIHSAWKHGWKWWSLGNLTWRARFLGVEYLSPEERQDYQQQFSVLRKLSDERKAVYFKRCSVREAQYREHYSKNRLLIEIQRNTLIPLPSCGPNGDISREYFIPRCTLEDVREMEYFKSVLPSSELARRNEIIKLVKVAKSKVVKIR